MQNQGLNPAERVRYDRQLQMPDFGEAEQLKIRAAKVLVIGAGGLGVPILQYLAGAGVGTIGIIDYDRIELSNLHRQVFYKEREVGQSKAITAKVRVEEQNSGVTCRAYQLYLDPEQALAIFPEYDIVVDATDNFPTRYLVNDACYLLGKPLVYGAIYRFEGQVAVFNQLVGQERSTNYRDLFPTPPAADLVPNCNEAGVLGILPGIIGTLQASEVLKLITGLGEPLVDQLFTLDVLNYDNFRLKIRQHPANPLRAGFGAEQLSVEGQLCQLHPLAGQPTSINYQELLAEQQANPNLQLVDVRDLKEHLASNIGGICIPLSQLSLRFAEIDRDQPAVLYCRSGRRSTQAIRLLQQEHGFTLLRNLEGGLQAVERR
ncbi:MAG: HesA/MoeB/ThiF family protein [Bacteroidota bacterium]